MNGLTRVFLPQSVVIAGNFLGRTTGIKYHSLAPSRSHVQAHSRVLLLVGSVIKK